MTFVSSQFFAQAFCASQPCPSQSIASRMNAEQRFSIREETGADVVAREDLLDAAFGPARFLKTCEKLRAGRAPAAGLALVATEGRRIVGTVRLWNVHAGFGRPALMLGPLAVAADCRAHGVGAGLMREALGLARKKNHRAVLLVGDAPYYERFGFSRRLTEGLSMPGPVEAERFLALELVAGALDNAAGRVTAAGVSIAFENDRRLPLAA